MRKTMALKASPDKTDKRQIMNVKKNTDNENTPDNSKQKGGKKKITLGQRDTTLVIKQTINQSMFPSNSLCYSYPPILSPPYTSLPVVTMSPYNPQFTMSNYTYPDIHWSSFYAPMSVANSIYTVPMPSLPTVIQPQIMSTQVCPYTTLIPSPVVAEPLYPVVTPFAPLDTTMCNMSYDGFCYDQIVPTINEFVPRPNLKKGTSRELILSFDQLDLESYLTLPKDLFPTARMLKLNPNTIIDVLCKESNIHTKAPWILDLEFGMPRAPVTRPIAIYDVQYNSIHCKNTPEAIHPGFESCTQDFKKVISFYYDCITSAWYNGFIIMNSDTSVANFQSWLQLPMQDLGLCWP